MYRGYRSGVVRDDVEARATDQLCTNSGVRRKLTLDLTTASRSDCMSVQTLYRRYNLCSLIDAKDSMSFLAFSTSTN